MPVIEFLDLNPLGRVIAAAIGVVILWAILRFLFKLQIQFAALVIAILVAFALTAAFSFLLGAFVFNGPGGADTAYLVALIVGFIIQATIIGRWVENGDAGAIGFGAALAGTVMQVIVVGIVSVLVAVAAG